MLHSLLLLMMLTSLRQPNIGLTLKELVSCNNVIISMICTKEEVMSDVYKRIVFFNITAKPVREQFTLGHMFRGQLNMLGGLGLLQK